MAAVQRHSTPLAELFYLLLLARTQRRFPEERLRNADTPLGPATVFACTHEYTAQSLENYVGLAMAGSLSMAMCQVIKSEPGLTQPESPNAALTEAEAQALGVPIGR